MRFHALDKPKYDSPIFEKQHAASHYTISSNDKLQYKLIIDELKQNWQRQNGRIHTKDGLSVG